MKRLPRDRKPFWHDRLQCWYGWIHVNGKRKMVRLSKDEDEALRLWHELRANEKKTDKPVKGQIKTVQAVIGEFLEWVQKQPKTAEKTFRWYKTYLAGSSKTHRGKPKANNSFGVFVGPKLKITELRLPHVEKWLHEKLSEASDNGRNGAVRAIRRMVRWAQKRGILQFNPIEGVEVPQYQPRDVRISPDQWTALLAAIPAGDEFADFLRCLRATGMRPFELRIVEARHLQGNQLLFDVSESKGKRYRRAVPLNDAATELLTRLAKERPEGKLFRNTRGKPWTKYSITARMSRFRKKAGLGEEITLYAIRHEFISAAIETEAVDPVTLAKIVGHRDLTMISRIYSHHAAQGEHLQRAVRRATGEMAD